MNKINKILSVSTIFESFTQVTTPYIEIERLDVADLNGFCTSENENGLISEPHIVIVRSPNKRIDNSVLGVTDKHIMFFSGEQNATSFVDNFIGCFSATPMAAIID